MPNTAHNKIYFKSIKIFEKKTRENIIYDMKCIEIAILKKKNFKFSFILFLFTIKSENFQKYLKRNSIENFTVTGTSTKTLYTRA